MIGNAAEHVGQLGLWIDGVELCRFDQGIRVGCRMAAALRAHDEIIFFAHTPSPTRPEAHYVAPLQHADFLRAEPLPISVRVKHNLTQRARLAAVS